MKCRIMITGMIYQYRDGKSMRETMEHLESDEPEVCLVRTVSHDYGVEVEAKERRVVMGKVSRFDLLDVLDIMRMKGFGTLKGRVVSACREGGWFVVETDAPDDFVSSKGVVPQCWLNWSVPQIPLMADIPGHSELESVISYLDAALHCPDEFDVETTVENIDDLIAMSRYDVTMETQMALKEFRRLVDCATDGCVHGRLPKLVNAINEMGSSQRTSEYDEVFYQMIVDSDEATDMINAWYQSFAHTVVDDITLEDIQRNKLREIEQSLQMLPDDLFREVDRKGRLLHLLLYKGIPYEKYRGLMSALVMRDHLLDELETVMEFSGEEEEEVVSDNPLDTAEAWALWRKAQAKGWVDDNRQPLVSQNKAAILASVIAHTLDIKPRWAPFESLWGIPNLAQKVSKAIGCKYYSETDAEYAAGLM